MDRHIRLLDAAISEQENALNLGLRSGTRPAAMTGHKPLSQASNQPLPGVEEELNTTTKPEDNSALHALADIATLALSNAETTLGSLCATNPDPNMVPEATNPDPLVDQLKTSILLPAHEILGQTADGGVLTTRTRTSTRTQKPKSKSKSRPPNSIATTVALPSTTTNPPPPAQPIASSSSLPAPSTTGPTPTVPNSPSKTPKPKRIRKPRPRPRKKTTSGQQIQMQTSSGSAMVDVDPATGDPNEPRYCYCNGISSGDVRDFLLYALPLAYRGTDFSYLDDCMRWKQLREGMVPLRVRGYLKGSSRITKVVLSRLCCHAASQEEEETVIFQASDKGTQQISCTCPQIHHCTLRARERMQVESI